MSREKNSGIVLGLLAGAAIGSLLGVLFAPEKGRETRKRLRRKAEDLRDEAFEQYEQLSEKAKQGVEKLKQEYEKYKSHNNDKSGNGTELDAMK